MDRYVSGRVVNLYWEENNMLANSAIVTGGIGSNNNCLPVGLEGNSSMQSSINKEEIPAMMLQGGFLP